MSDSGKGYEVGGKSISEPGTVDIEDPSEKGTFDQGSA